ncbi:MAG: TonB family protein [Pseudodesulfovibrio sp.]|uniref:Cell division and transport-associated protein TolA n=1 Tax=Pseudodesulfovibrio indicus TaxID=1716143 RepID=A0A126QQB1_9BACT|nr:TonB family protein [Pseudodesulfovibrio indicus]AMK11665.1 cell envelope biogenesis protein TolA [Pseudodesulfovibrio indicus]TDT88191.1 cell division and transport-associated protein TolA [Pseudodesulfovibrio indicus]
MRQSYGFLISVLFHAGLAAFALYGVNYTGVRVDMDRPVYTVDLVTLAPPPPGPPVEVQAKAEAPAETAEVPVVAARPEPVAEVKPTPVVEAKPEPEVKDISPKKVEKKTVVTKKEEKPKPEPKPEPKPKPKPQKTAQQLLAEGMAAAKAQAKREDAAKRKALASELAALKKREGDEVYAHGGQPGGQEGGREGGTVGGSGSGLSEVYALIVGAAIKKNWRYPAFAGEANLLATIEITLDEDGKILSSKVLQPSNNPEFDSSALRAIKETEYVEKPRTVRDRVIRINFNSQELAE